MRADALGFFWFDEPVKKEVKAPPPKREAPPRTWESPDYLPDLEKALAYNPEPLTEYDLFAAPPHEELLFDIECYPNYFCANFESSLTGKVMEFELSPWARFDPAKLKWVLETFCSVGFNSNSYDLCIAALACNGASTQELHAATDLLINQGMRAGDVLRNWKVRKLAANHIDMIEVAPLRANLKIYGGRHHSKRMQDLPFKPGIELTYHQSRIVRYYNLMADLKATKLIRQNLQPQIMLRYEMSNEYKIDLRSKSDAQIAEAVIADAIRELNGRRPVQPEIDPGTTFRYKVPANVGFQTDLLKWVLQTVASSDFIVAEHGAVTLPPAIGDMDIKIGKMTYQMGIGGLHSTEKKTIHVADKTHRLLDRDVTSFYPRIILNQGLYPAHLGPNFLRVYRGIVERRIAAKAAGHKSIAESLKITINGSFGKLGSKYSVLYAPDLLFQVTISGQLYLLMMIEQMELHGIEVISANTDGVVMRVPSTHQHIYEAIIKWWEKATDFETEEVEYLALYSRDVNNYFAVKAPDKKGKIGTKNKGQFANPWSSEDDGNLEKRFHKNPANQICIDAIEALFTKGVPLDHTIRQCTDITKFISVRTVTGGAVQTTHRILPEKADMAAMVAEVQSRGGYQLGNDAWLWPGEPDTAGRYIETMYKQCIKSDEQVGASYEYLGKSIRWYYSTERRGQEMVYAKNGNRVPRSEGAMKCLDLPDQFPRDIDFDWYIEEATSILQDVGYY